VFNVKEVIREVEAEKNPKSEDDPRAKRANRANFRLVFSTISTFSTSPSPENEDIGKLESLKLIYGDPNQNQSDVEVLTDALPIDSVPFTDHEIAEHKINGLALREDRSFVRQMLLDAYGKGRLDLVEQYFTEWHKGATAEPVEVKKENAGRKRANTWLRQERNRA
jgi:hypothetical protein